MTDPRGPVDPATLMAFVDGRLGPDERRAFEARLRADPALASEVRAYEAQRAALHAAFDPVLEEPIPAAMLGAAPPRPRTAPLARIAAAVALVAAGAVAGSAGTRAWLARRDAGPAGELASFARQAIVSHAAFAPDARRPVEIAAEQQQALVTWLSKRLGRDVRAPFLEDRGLRLVGGRLLPGDVEHPAAQLMYETTAGARVTLFIRAVGADAPPAAFRVREEAGVSAFYWVEDDWGYALTGELGRAELLDLAKVVHERIRGN
ncbi:MAG TPA: anti-sigma factor [Anaeromyxobacter sp.]|nr:anti-sigma factor [Anaeromyxobacter sp.]